MKKLGTSKLHFLILGITAIGIVLIVIYIYEFFINNKYQYHSEYNNATAIEQVDEQFFKDAGEEFEIGLNKLKYPVFKNVDLALYALNEKYESTLSIIKEQFNLDDLSSLNYEDYSICAPMIKTDDDQVKEDAEFISQFAMIYKNSFSENK